MSESSLPDATVDAVASGAGAAAASTADLASSIRPSPGAASSASAVASSGVAAGSRLLNINIGVLGHVDAGKTSLAKALSSVLSTAALDKAPQSQARGMTLDLGFSALFIDAPEHMRDRYDRVQCTLVDCPGHASLIRTVLGGAAIIDLMLLVVDATKGMQTQTAECLIVGEILTERMIVVLNKVDLLTDKDKQLAKLEKGLRQVFSQTKFGRDVLMVPVSANPASADDLKPQSATSAAAATSATAGDTAASVPDVSGLISALKANLVEPARIRLANDPFLFVVDHCFPLKGQGSVLTGTVMSGRVALNQVVEIPALKLERKVKSMQMFKRSVDHAVQGDRLGICVTQLDAKLIERGLLCTPGSVQTYDSVIAVVDKVRFFKGQCLNKAKFHVSIGHSTAMATVHFFGGPLPTSKPPITAASKTKSSTKDSKATTSSAASSSSSASAAASSSSSSSPPGAPLAPASVPLVTEFNFDQDYAWRDELIPVSTDVAPHTQYAILEFEKPVQCPLQSILIGSRLDADIHLNSCRIAFQGRLLRGIDWSSPVERARLRVYKLKERVGTIDRVVDERTLIGRDLFSHGTDMGAFVGMKVELETGERGVIEGAFGQGGKFKAYFQDGLPLPPSSVAAAAAAAASEPTLQGRPKAAKINLKGKIFLRFKKYAFAADKKAMIQA